MGFIDVILPWKFNIYVRAVRAMYVSSCWQGYK